jgi:hypothetical protein
MVPLTGPPDRRGDDGHGNNELFAAHGPPSQARDHQDTRRRDYPRRGDDPISAETLDGYSGTPPARGRHDLAGVLLAHDESTSPA